MRKRKKEAKGADPQYAIEAYVKAQDLIARYEATQDPALLPEMRKIKPDLQAAVRSMSGLLRVPKERAQLKAIPAMALNSLGGICLYLKDYSEAWDCYEKSRDLALESSVPREIVQATNNLGSVALNQRDFDVALEQFQMAHEHCADRDSPGAIHR